MKNKRRRLSRFSAKTVIILLAAAIVCGFLLDHLLTVVEKRIYPIKYSEYVEKYSEAFGVPQSVIYSVIKTESDFVDTAVSSASAHGLMQLTEETFFDVAKMLGETPSAFDIYDPETNIRYGTRYLFYLYQMYDENWNTAFAAYNAGLGNVNKWLEDPYISDKNGNLTSIPFEETENYVKKVNKAIKKYEKLYDLRYKEIENG